PLGGVHARQGFDLSDGAAYPRRIPKARPGRFGIENGCTDCIAAVRKMAPHSVSCSKRNPPAIKTIIACGFALVITRVRSNAAAAALVCSYHSTPAGLAGFRITATRDKFGTRSLSGWTRLPSSSGPE